MRRSTLATAILFSLASPAWGAGLEDGTWGETSAVRTEPEVVRRRLKMVVNAFKCVLLRTNAYIPTGRNSRNVNKIKQLIEVDGTALKKTA